MIMKSLLELFLIFCISRIAAGCRCGIVDENERYCQADFALIARVIGEGASTDNERVYKISEKINLKPLIPDYSVIRRKIYTATNSGACGVILDKGSVYLLAGHYRETVDGYKKQHLGLCSIVRKLTKSEAKAYTPPTC